jgi:hypothetical protein
VLPPPYLTMLVVLLVLPAAIYAQGTDPEAVVMAFFEAFNAGDVESAVAYYADDAFWHIQPFYEPYVGKEAIRAACETMVAGHAVVEYEILQKGTRISCSTSPGSALCPIPSEIIALACPKLSRCRCPSPPRGT